MKENSIEILLLLIITITCVLLVIINTDLGNNRIRGTSYSNYNVITYDNDETLLHEVCHVVVDNDPEDYFNDNNLKRFCE